MIPQRKKSNSSKVNLIISAVFHTVLVVCIFYFAAKEGLLGKKLKELTVTMEKTKKPEPPKEKPEEPKVQPKTEEAKASVPQPKIETVAPPPAASEAAAPAPAAVALPSFSFQDGAIDVATLSSDPNTMYKTLVEHTLHSYWNRPEDMADDSFVAEVALKIDKSGEVLESRWVSGSGDARWDQSVKDAVAQLKTISRPPPKGFPNEFVVKFDVESAKADAIEFSSR